MADVREMRIFSAEQIDVPDAFPGILKNFILGAEPCHSQSGGRVFETKQWEHKFLNVGGVVANALQC